MIINNNNVEAAGLVTFHYLEGATRHDGFDETAVHNDELLFVSLSENESAHQTYVAAPRPHALYTFLLEHILNIINQGAHGYSYYLEICKIASASALRLPCRL
jgi:hypothetical protein